MKHHSPIITKLYKVRIFKQWTFSLLQCDITYDFSPMTKSSCSHGTLSILNFNGFTRSVKE